MTQSRDLSVVGEVQNGLLSQHDQGEGGEICSVCCNIHLSGAHFLLPSIYFIVWLTKIREYTWSWTSLNFRLVSSRMPLNGWECPLIWMKWNVRCRSTTLLGKMQEGKNPRRHSQPASHHLNMTTRIWQHARTHRFAGEFDLSKLCQGLPLTYQTNGSPQQTRSVSSFVRDCKISQDDNNTTIRLRNEKQEKKEMNEQLEILVAVFKRNNTPVLPFRC